MTENQPPIEVSGLEKRFGTFRAVKSISFSVARGEIFGFLGANGAGKSTTIKMLCGLLPPTSGTAHVAGIDVAHDPEGVKRRIGYMCQKFSLYRDLTVSENLWFFGGVYGLPEQRRAVRREEMLTLLDLAPFRDMLAGDLPRGFQQRLAFACAVLHEPEIIFLDEPTAGVDPIQRRTFWDIIASFAAAGITAFVTTHFLDEAEFCHRVSLMVDGEIVACDTPMGLKRSLAPLRFYEVVSAETASLLPATRSLPFIHSAALFGDALHVVTDGSITAETVAAALPGNPTVTAIPPTLEDVFLWYAERQA